MPEPVAILALDSRSYGPATCEHCGDEDVEDAILMSDATLVCPECGTPLEGFDFMDAFTSASPIKKKPKWALGARATLSGTRGSWDGLVAAARNADADAWGSIAKLWPEVSSGDVDPLFSGVYTLNINRLAALWATANHPDPEFRRDVLFLAEGHDPYFETRGQPAPGSGQPIGGIPRMEDWKPNGGIPLGEMVERLQASVGRYFDVFLPALTKGVPEAGDVPMPVNVLMEFVPCLISMLIHWLEANHPDKNVVRKLRARLEEGDPDLMERCGAQANAPQWTPRRA